MVWNIITNIDASYAIDVVRIIFNEVGPGLPGSYQEQKRASIIKRELESNLGEENVKIEEFNCAPWAFVSAYPVTAIMMLLSTLLNISIVHLPAATEWLTSIGALVFSLLAFLGFVLEFVLGKEFMDPLFKKKQSMNVIGTLNNPRTKNVKRLLLIFSGHHDSAPENTWLRFLGYGFFILSGTFIIGMIAIPVMNVIQLTGLITGHNGLVHFGTIGLGFFIYPVIPFFIFAFFFFRGTNNGGKVPGAADNLSATALNLALCRFLVNNPSFIPNETEIRFISFGSEEAGCRGSKRYVERHLKELKQLDARLLNLETIAHPELTILTSDLNGTVKNSPELIKTLVEAAEHAEVPYRIKPAYFGISNDSGPFSQAGIKAATILSFKIPQQLVAFYHQKWDKPENLTIEPFLNLLRLTLNWIRSEGDQIF